jgi:hypothetical protein
MVRIKRYAHVVNAEDDIQQRDDVPMSISDATINQLRK